MEVIFYHIASASNERYIWNIKFMRRILRLSHTSTTTPTFPKTISKTAADMPVHRIGRLRYLCPIGLY
jgi:hypothetical protein